VFCCRTYIVSDTDAYNYIKLCDFLKLLMVSMCQCLCRVRCSCLYLCFIHYKKCCILPGLLPDKMQKALAIGRLPGVLPGAESPANLLIANEYARALVPGKFAPSTGPESNFSAYNLSGVTAICEGFAPGILSGLKLQFAKGFPGITSSKFARS